VLQVLQEHQGDQDSQANQDVRVILALQEDNHIVQSHQKAVIKILRPLHALDQLQVAITVVVAADQVVEKEYIDSSHMEFKLSEHYVNQGGWSSSNRYLRVVESRN
jgi:hypothetical protein